MSKILYASISIAATISIVFFFLPNSKPSIDMIGVDSIAIQSYLEEDNLENIEFDTEWFTISNNTSLLLDGINSSQNSIVDYLQQETDLTDLIIN